MTIPEYDLSRLDVTLEKRKKGYRKPSYNSIGAKTPWQDRDFQTIISLYHDALALEKAGKASRALDYYIYILLTYVPLGCAYYERPAILLERQKYFRAALKVCDLMFLTMQWQRDIERVGYTEIFTKRKDRLTKKLGMQ